MIEQSTEGLADPLLAILDRSAVAMATGSPWLVFGAASGITAQDFALRTHLVSANTNRISCSFCFYFSRASGVIISQINRHCSSAQQLIKGTFLLS